MKRKYDFSRVSLKLMDLPPYESQVMIFKKIKMYHKAIKELGPTHVEQRAHSKYPEFQEAIKELRIKSKKFRKQRYIFEAYVKQYKRTVTSEWNMPTCELGTAYRKEYKDMIKGVMDNAIRQCREEFKGSAYPSKFGGGAVVFEGQKKGGRVFTKEGEVLRIYVDKNLKNLYTDKRPTEPKKYIGIELEFCAPIKENLFAIKLFRSGIHKFAQLKKDGSLRPKEDLKEVGYELAILLEESNYKKRLKQITDLLIEVKAVAIDRRAGLHVHLDMRRRNKDLVYNNLVACQFALLSIVDPKRYNNEFCRVVESRKFPTEFTGEREERYKTINAAAFYKYKTLEVRMHEGSVDFAQISNWVDLLVKIANHPKKLKYNYAKVSAVGKRIPLPKKLFKYILDRSCFWQVQNDPGTQHLRSDSRDYAHVRAAAERVRRTQMENSVASVGMTPTPSGRPPWDLGLEIADAPSQLTYTYAPVPATPSIPLTEPNRNVRLSVDEVMRGLGHTLTTTDSVPSWQDDEETEEEF